MTDLRDRARDEADIRQRLSDLAATITSDTTWDQLHTLLTTSPPPRSHRRAHTLGRVRLAAAAVVIVLAAAALLAGRQAGVLDTADTPGSTATTTPTEEATTTTAPTEATSTPGTPDAGDSPTDPARPSGDGAAAGDGPATPTSRSLPGATPGTTTGPSPVSAPIPAGASPDGYPVGVAYGGGGFNPTVTYHQDGDNVVVDVWVNLGADGVQHLDTLVVTPRQNQNCLILGATSAPPPNPYPTVSPQRIIGGVVTTRIATLSVSAPGGGIALIGRDVVAGDLHPVLVLVDADTFRVDAAGTAGFVQHTVTESDRDAFPDTC
jgi:hypothetical protein